MNPPERTSWLAVLSFGASILSATVVTAAWITTGYADVATMVYSKLPVAPLALGSRIAAGVGIVAAVAAMAFCIAARSAVRESQGRVGGRGFYHVAGIVSAASGIIAATLL